MSVATSLPPMMPSTPVRRFTVAEYHQMIEVGVISLDERIELIEGWIVPKMPNNPPHATTAQLVTTTLGAIAPPGWCVRMQLPITLDDSEPEPDAVIARGSLRDYSKRHPGPNDFGIVIEVSSTTARTDRRRKARLYARAGIPVYWIVDVDSRTIDVLTNPDPGAAQPQYRNTSTFGPNDRIPLEFNGLRVAELAVSDLMP